MAVDGFEKMYDIRDAITDVDNIKKMIIDLQLLKHEFAKLGMWKTMHKIDDALKTSGWELADKISK